MTILPADLVKAYRSTIFCVFAQPPFELRVDRYSSELASLYQTYRVESAVYITACNPLGQEIAKVENDKAQQNLKAVIEATGVEFLAGEGRDPTGEWPGESSFLVLGWTRTEGLKHGVAFKQNAILWCGADGIPILELLR